LLQHIWKQKLTEEPKTFEELGERFKFTPRVWRKKNDFIYILKTLSWTLNININYLGFTTQHIACKHDTKTFLLVYKFQNTLVKLLRQPHPFRDITLFLFKKKIYVLKPDMDITKLNPYLTNVLSSKKAEMSKTDIIKILQRASIKLPQDVKIFSAYFFGKISNQLKVHNFIAHYKSEKTDQPEMVLFISPNLSGSDFDIYKLDACNIEHSFNPLSSLSHAHKQEGDPCYKKKPQLDKPLNQDFCICDHEEIRQIFPNPKFKSLGMIFYSFFYLNNII
jgi:hypothetical protein